MGAPQGGHQRPRRGLRIGPGNGPADDGLRPGDLILAVDGKPTPTVDAVHRLLGRQTIGRALELRVLRQGQILELSATVAGQPEDKSPRPSS